MAVSPARGVKSSRTATLDDADAADAGPLDDPPAAADDSGGLEAALFLLLPVVIVETPNEDVVEEEVMGVGVVSRGGRPVRDTWRAPLPSAVSGDAAALLAPLLLSETELRRRCGGGRG